MHNLYFAKNKSTQSLSNTNTLLKMDQRGSDSWIDHRIDLIEQQLNQLAMSHNHSMIQIDHLVVVTQYEIDKSKDYINADMGKNQKKISQKIEQLQYRLAIILQSEKEQILQKRNSMKRFIQDNERIMTEIIRAQMQEENKIIKNLDQIAEKNLKEIKNKMQGAKSNKKTSYSKSQKSQRDPKNKLRTGIETLGNLLARHKQQNNQMKKQGSKLLKEYLRLLEEIQEGKRDREAKQQQLLVKIEQMSIGEMTKEHTLSRIQ